MLPISKLSYVAMLAAAMTFVGCEKPASQTPETLAPMPSPDEIISADDPSSTAPPAEPPVAP